MIWLPRGMEGADLARHRSPGGQDPSPVLEQALNSATVRGRGSHRLPAPSSALRGRVMVAAVAAGAFAAAAAGQTLQTPNNSPQQRHTDVTPLANASDASASLNSGGASGVGGDAPAGSPVLLQVSHSVDASAEAQNSPRGRVTRRLEREAEERRRPPRRPRPGSCACTGRVHPLRRPLGATYGIDIANSIGTPDRCRTAP